MGRPILNSAFLFCPTHTNLYVVLCVLWLQIGAITRMWPQSHTYTLYHLPCANVATQSYLNFLIIREITDPREL